MSMATAPQSEAAACMAGSRHSLASASAPCRTTSEQERCSAITPTTVLHTSGPRPVAAITECGAERSPSAPEPDWGMDPATTGGEACPVSARSRGSSLGGDRENTRSRTLCVGAVAVGRRALSLALCIRAHEGKEAAEAGEEVCAGNWVASQRGVA